MPLRQSNIFKSDLKNQFGFDGSHRSKALQRIASDPVIDAIDFTVGETGIGFGDRYQLLTLPQRKRIVRVKIGAPARARLRVEKNGVYGVRIDFPFPPVAFFATDLVRRFAAFLHQTFHTPAARFFAQIR